jgi:hypothetical protein
LTILSAPRQESLQELWQRWKFRNSIHHLAKCGSSKLHQRPIDIKKLKQTLLQEIQILGQEEEE